MLKGKSQGKGRCRNSPSGLPRLAPLFRDATEVRRLLRETGDAANYSGSAFKEYVVRANTVGNVLDILKNKVADVFRQKGDEMLPGIKEAALGLGDVIDTLGERASVLDKVSASVQGFAKGLGYDGGIREAVNDLGDLLFGEADGSGAADELGRLFKQAEGWGESLRSLNKAVSESPLAGFFREIGGYGVSLAVSAAGIGLLASAVSGLAAALYTLSGARAAVGILKMLGKGGKWGAAALGIGEAAIGVLDEVPGKSGPRSRPAAPRGPAVPEPPKGGLPDWMTDGRSSNAKTFGEGLKTVAASAATLALRGAVGVLSSPISVAVIATLATGKMLVEEEPADPSLIDPRRAPEKDNFARNRSRTGNAFEGGKQRVAAEQDLPAPVAKTAAEPLTLRAVLNDLFQPLGEAVKPQQEMPAPYKPPEIKPLRWSSRWRLGQSDVRPMPAGPLYDYTPPPINNRPADQDDRAEQGPTFWETFRRRNREMFGMSIDRAHEKTQEIRLPDPAPQGTAGQALGSVSATMAALADRLPVAGAVQSVRVVNDLMGPVGALPVPVADNGPARTRGGESDARRMPSGPFTKQPAPIIVPAARQPDARVYGGTIAGALLDIRAGLRSMAPIPQDDVQANLPSPVAMHAPSAPTATTELAGVRTTLQRLADRLPMPGVVQRVTIVGDLLRPIGDLPLLQADPWPSRTKGGFGDVRPMPIGPVAPAPTFGVNLDRLSAAVERLALTPARTPADVLGLPKPDSSGADIAAALRSTTLRTQPTGTQDVMVRNPPPRPNVNVSTSITINEATDAAAVSAMVNSRIGDAVRGAVESSYADGAM